MNIRCPFRTWPYSCIWLCNTREELELMNHRTRKLMAVYKALHPRDDVDGLFSRKEGGRGHASIEDSVDASRQRRKDYIDKCGEKVITATRNNTDDTRISRTEITRKKR